MSLVAIGVAESLRDSPKLCRGFLTNLCVTTLLWLDRVLIASDRYSFYRIGLNILMTWITSRWL